MYKPRPITDKDLDIFLAEYAMDSETYERKAQKAYHDMYKRPVPRLGLLQAVIGGVLFAGSIMFIVWWLVPVYERLMGGIQ